jgi:hypothetical protein
MKTKQLLPLALAVLLAGCSIFADEAKSLLILDAGGSLVSVDAPSYRVQDGIAEINVSIENRANESVFLSMPRARLYRLENTEMKLAYNPPTTAELRPPTEIAAGERYDFLFAIDVRDAASDPAWILDPVDGTYRVDVSLHAERGNEGNFYRGEPIEPAFRLSELFDIAF